MPDQREVVLDFIKNTGPVLPFQVAKALNTSILFSSAILSELVDRKLIKISHAAIGGSPLYYLQGQEALMDEKLHNSLGGREKEAYFLIKDRKIVREKDLEPWQRVAIKSLRDFTKQIIIVINNEQDYFWKHNLVSDDEAKILIEDYVKNNLQQNIITTSNPIIEVSVMEDNLIQEPIIVQHKEDQFVNEEKLMQSNNLERQNIVREVMKSIKEEFKNEKQDMLNTEKIKEVKIDGKFYTHIVKFLEKSGIEILNEELVKKEKEINFIVNIPSNFGKLRYLVIAKSKPSINESDISMAFAEGQLKKLPVILLFDGKLNKKVEKLIETKFNGQVIVKEI